MKNMIVLGATSAIAQSFCRLVAPSGVHFFLLGRNRERLQIVAEDLLVRGAKAAEVRVLVPGDYLSLESAIQDCWKNQNGIDLFLAAQGLLPSQDQCESDPLLLGEVFQVNTTEIMQASLLVARNFEAQGRGVCVILGSVAGDRGRRNNYVYGSSKASLETFCQGLRQRMEPLVRVLLVKPGPVDTPMTSYLTKNALFCSPEKVASDILRELQGDSKILYTPFYWRWIMLMIRWLPDQVVKRLRA